MNAVKYLKIEIIHLFPKGFNRLVKQSDDIGFNDLNFLMSDPQPLTIYQLMPKSCFFSCHLCIIFFIYIHVVHTHLEIFYQVEVVEIQMHVHEWCILRVLAELPITVGPLNGKMCNQSSSKMKILASLKRKWIHELLLSRLTPILSLIEIFTYILIIFRIIYYSKPLMFSPFCSTTLQSGLRAH